MEQQEHTDDVQAGQGSVEAPARRRKSRDIDMLHGPLLGKIMLFAVPLIITSCMQQLFNTADTAISGQFVSNQALASVGATMPLINLLVNIFIGLSVGANVVVAQRVALGVDRNTHDAVHTSMAVALICGFGLIVVAFALTDPLLAATSTPADVWDGAGAYLRIYVLGGPFIMVYNFGSAVLRAKGDTRGPLYSLAVACVANLALDLLFTIVVPWGVAGVAVATTVSNAISAVIVLRIIISDQGPTHFSFRDLCIVRTHLVTILKIGVPSAVQGAVFAVSNLVIQSAINGFGAEAIAGSTAGLNFEIYAFFFVNSFVQTAVTFTGQNYAMGNIARCKRILAICMACGIGITLGLCGIYVLILEPMLSLFTASATAISFGVIRMLHVGCLEFMTGIYEIPGGAMRGMGKSMTPAAITIVGTCVLRIAWVMTVFAAVPTFDMLMTVYPISWAVTGAATLAAYALFMRRETKLRAADGATTS